jgi:hypothetical protein
MEIMLTKPLPRSGKPDHVTSQPELWTPTPATMVLSAIQSTAPSAVRIEPLDRRKIRLRWD